MKWNWVVLGMGFFLASVASSAAAPARTDPVVADPRRDVVVGVVERVLPCVVNIATEEVVEYRDPFTQLFQEFWAPYYRNRPRSTRYSLGSGVIIDEEGHVLTNLHVVQRATKVWVQLHDGREFEARPMVGTSRRDVAVLKLVAPESTRFDYVKFAQDDDLLLGETVLALGNPFGLGGSVSRGILSSKNRRPVVDAEQLDIADWLQTDAAINPGSSGGPLVNLRGELIGLNVAVYREGQGIGFAIPIRQVVEAMADILTPEVMEGLWFGARLRGGEGSLEVLAVDPGSPAEKAGLRAGDAVLQVDGKAPRNLIQLPAMLTARGDREVSLTVKREGERRTLTVRLQTLADLIQRRLGLTVQEMDTEVAQQFGLRPRQGLLVADVERGGPAALSRIQAGQVLVRAEGVVTQDLLSLANALASKKKNDTVELGILVQRNRGFFSQLGEARISVKVR